MLASSTRGESKSFRGNLLNSSSDNIDLRRRRRRLKFTIDNAATSTPVAVKKIFSDEFSEKARENLKSRPEKCQLPPLHLEAAGCVAIDGKPTPACGGFIVNTSQRTHVNFCYNDNEFNLLYFRLRMIQGLPSSSSLLSVVCCVKSERNFQDSSGNVLFPPSSAYCCFFLAS